MEEPKTMISIEGVGKSFKLPHEKTTSIKSAVVNFYRRNKTYETQKALSNINFEVKQGEFFGIIGRNGSGKSTLLKLLAGIYVPTEGKVRVNGHLTPFIELGVGFNPELTGRENVFLNGALLGFDRKQMRAMYDKIVEFAEIKKFMDQKLKNYSSGMQVRLAFSIAIQAKSDILLVDEVLAVGDLAFQEKCYKVFDEIKKSGRTVVFISHDGSAIERFCDRVAIVDRGKLINIGKPRDMVLEYGAIVAGEQYEKDSGSKKASNHQGNGAITVNKVQILNSEGKQAPSLEFGEAFDVEIRYKLNKAIQDTVIVGVDIIDEQGVSILGPNTKDANLKPTIKKSGKIVAHFTGTPLRPTTYTVTVGFFNANASLAYDLVENVTQFKVIGEHRHGKIYIEPEWSIAETTK